MDGPSYESTHQLLLALAGHVDDDLLGWARELLAVGEEARAVSVATAAVVAERISLPAPVRVALVEAGRTARVGIDPADLAAPAELPVAHRFAADAGATDVVAAVRALPARRLQDTAAHLTWRLTPAGTAPGPLPHPVVLLEIQSARQSGEVLAYQVATGLARLGVHASVEVVTAGQERTAYHVAAFGNAAMIDLRDPDATTSDAPEPAPAAARPVPVAEPAGGTAHADAAPPVEPATGTAPDDAPAEEPGDEADEAAAGAADATADTTDTGPVRIVAAAPPAAPQSRPQSRPEPRPALHPLADAPRPPPRPVVGSPALSALSDPLAGPPPVQPAVQPADSQHDPTIHEHDPLGVDHLMRSSPRPSEQQTPVRENPPDPVVEDSWAAEWESGAWAIPLDEPDPGPVPGRAGPVEGPVGPPPHRGRPFAAPRGAGDPGRDARGADGTPSVPPAEHRPEPQAATARLSSADRELLARLQADLQDGRRTRTPRRTDTTSGRRQVTNGHGPDHPPDIAG